MTNTCAIVTARGGSKGLKNKNIRLLNGIHLIGHSIRAALGCDDIDRCVVTTDSPEIAYISETYGAEVIMRPSELSTDTSRSEDAVLHALDTLEADGYIPQNFILLQPTSPLRTSRHLSESLKLYFEESVASCISVAECEHHPYKCFIVNNRDTKPLFGRQFLSMPRQELPKIIRQNGAIYIASTAAFRRHISFYIEPAAFYAMSHESSIDIDTEIDFFVAELLLSRRETNI